MSFLYYNQDDQKKRQQEADPIEPSTPTPQEPSKYPSPDELVKNIYSIRPPEPVFDRAKAARLQKMGKLNALGRSFGVVGDILSLGLGANVRRRQPDNISPALYTSFEGMMDKYKNDEDTYRFAQYQKQMQDAQLGITHGYRREDQAWREQVHKDEMQTQRDKNTLDFNKWMADYTQRGEKNRVDAAYKQGDLGYKGTKLQADENYRYAKLQQDRELAMAKALAQYFKDNTFMEVKIGGEDKKLTEGQYRGLLAEARKNFSDKDFNTMMEPYTNYPLEGLKNIVQRYSEYKYRQEQQATQQPLIDQVTQGYDFHSPLVNGQGPLRDLSQIDTAPLMQYPGENLEQLKSADFDSTKYLRK